MNNDGKKRRGREKTLTFIDRNRIFLLFGAVFLVMALFAPRFMTAFNLTTIMRTTAMNATAAIGFTLILIVGQLDLSIGTIITFAGVVGLGLKQYIGYGGSVPIAILAGCAIGLINGLLVAKAKISSFIVTLGMLTVLQGAIYTITRGNSISLSSPDAFAVSDWLAHTIIPLLTPRVVITLVLVAAFTVFLRLTRVGRNFYMVGGNRQTAWLSGMDTDLYTIVAFVISGFTAAVGGVLFAMEGAAATLNLGNTSLMYVISAVIIGGTAMSGGKGGVLKSFFAILMLDVLYNGIILFGLGNEVKIFIAGIILAGVVLYEAYTRYKHDKTVGQRPELLKEVDELKARIKTAKHKAAV
ncbi:MAG: ABC transporter permease [Spirochaetales bacterium]|nr:ABC transporter permease [Spirochaetales bacterium]